MIALGCAAPLFFFALLFFGISSVATTSQADPAEIPATAIAVTLTAPTPAAKLSVPQTQTFWIKVKPGKVSKIVVEEITGVGLEK